MIPTPTCPASATGLRGVLRDLLASYARTSRPRRVAVVGNAPMSPDSSRAALVDGCDLVLRITSLAVDRPGDLPALGRRCDVVVLHRGVLASPFTFADYTSRLYLLVEPGRLHWEPEALPGWWPADLGFVPVSNYEFTLPLIHLLGLDSTDPVWPTTGTLATYLVSELFPEATTVLTGTSIVDNPEQTTFRHAWGEAVEVTAEHRLHAESELLRRWNAEGRIRLLP
jgi:hypothetical protein